PVAGLRVSNVSPEAASTHSPPMKFLKVFVSIVAMRPVYGRLGCSVRLVRRVDLRERPGHTRAPPVAELALAAVRLPPAPILPRAAVDDHRHVRVVLVVLAE